MDQTDPVKEEQGGHDLRSDFTDFIGRRPTMIRLQVLVKVPPLAFKNQANPALRRRKRVQQLDEVRSVAALV